MKKKSICLYCSAAEYRDFLYIQAELGRSSEAETIRAMIQQLKKILSNNIAIASNANQTTEQNPKKINQ